MKIALVYDRINKWGGAERVLLALHKLFPDAPLYTLVYDKQNAVWASVFTVKTTFLQKIPFLRRHHEWLPFIAAYAFEQFNFDEFDVVVSITSAEAKGIITKPTTLHICYCLTPTRYLWSHVNSYINSRLKRLFSAPFIVLLRIWDVFASARPDYYVAISSNIQQRIEKYYRQKSTIIYPPILLETTKRRNGQDFQDKEIKKPFFLVVSRLVNYKRVDIAIEACNSLKLPLVVVGTGSEEVRLKAISGSTVLFRSNLTDSELSWYYEHCQALIAPQEEDFGLSMVEAQRFGKPVIAYQKGGANDIVKQGKTGYLFYPQTTQALEKVLKSFDGSLIKEQDCRENADRFTFEKFSEKLIKLVNEKNRH